MLLDCAFRAGVRVEVVICTRVTSHTSDLSFVELLKLMEFGFYGWRALTSLPFLFSPLPPFQTLVKLVKGLDFTYYFTRLREHT